MYPLTRFKRIIPGFPISINVIIIFKNSKAYRVLFGTAMDQIDRDTDMDFSVCPTVFH